MIAAVAIAASLALAGPASALTPAIHAPADGASVQLTDTVYFDWAWADDEYATAYVGFASSANGPWGSTAIRVQDCTTYGFCTSWLDSHASIPASNRRGHMVVAAVQQVDQHRGRPVPDAKLHPRKRADHHRSRSDASAYTAAYTSACAHASTDTSARAYS